MKGIFVALLLFLSGNFAAIYGQGDTLHNVDGTSKDGEGIKPDANKDGDDEQEQVWNISSAVRYDSRYTRYGVDLSEDQPALSIESEISHFFGFSAGFEAFTMMGTNGGYEHSSFHGGYQYPFNAFFSFAGTYTYNSYKTDTTSVLAGISNTISLIGTFTVSGYHLFGSYTLFFGGGTANYISAGATTIYEIGRLTLEPSIQFCFASQTVSDSLLPKNRGKAKGHQNGTATVLTTTITGVSNFSIGIAFRYPLGQGFVASVKPSYVYSPTDLSARTNQLILAIALEHSFDF
jgi:hypothetical protein